MAVRVAFNVSVGGRQRKEGNVSGMRMSLTHSSELDCSARYMLSGIIRHPFVLNGGAVEGYLNWRK